MAFVMPYNMLFGVDMFKYVFGAFIVYSVCRLVQKLIGGDIG